MTYVRIIGGVLVSFAGLVWALQGLGSEFVPQSFMTNNRLWIVIGIAAIAGGAAFAWRSWQQRP